MRILLAALIATAFAASTAMAAPATPKDGAEYWTLNSPQPVQASAKKVEVIEFFMYHCPACNAFEPSLAAWVAKQGDAIHFRRIHLPHSAENDPEAHLFLTLEAMGLEAAMHDKVEHTWHVEHKRLLTDAANFEWAEANGIDKAKFAEAYRSFGVIVKLNNLTRLATNYQVDGTPTLIVDGRYLTSPTMVKAANSGTPQGEVYDATLQVVDALVAKAAKNGAEGKAAAK